ALPPADFLLVTIAGLAAALCGWRRLGLVLVVLGICAGYLLTTPFIAGELAKMVETIPPVDLASVRPSGTQAIVILAAGLSPNAPEYAGVTIDNITLQRLRYGAHLWRLNELPILVSGGRAPTAVASLGYLMRKALETDFAVPVRWIEERSRDTYENAVFSAEILRAHGISKILLVTDASHIARAVAQFEEAGLTVIPAPTAFIAPSRTFPEDYMPRLSGLQGSYYALYELLGTKWYAARHRATARNMD
ncbi:MAG: YdcF family protein, partial [Rhodospirillaceae bacterium]